MRWIASLSAVALAIAPAAGAPKAKGLYAKTFGIKASRRVQTLIVVLHGDQTGDASVAPYDFAQAAAGAVPNSAVVALLRPGYADADGNQSPGVRGEQRGDNLTTDRIGMVARSIIDLRKRYRRANVILVGHSTGAAMAADVAGTYSQLMEGMVLASCPCTLPEWRAYMAKAYPDGGFKTPVTSLDPLQTSGGVSPTLRTAMLVGADDKAAPPRFSRTYAEALALRGIAVDFRILPDKGHAIMDEPELLDALQRVAAAIPARQRSGGRR